MTCRSLAFYFVLLIASTVTAQETSKPRLDADGKPLPDDAIARLGNTRFVSINGNASAIALSPDGKRAAVGAEGGYWIWNLETGKKGDAIQEDSCKALLWRHDRAAGISFDGDILGHDARKQDTSKAKLVAVRYVDSERYLVSVFSPYAIRDLDAEWRVEVWDREKQDKAVVWTLDEKKQALLKKLGQGYRFRYVALSPAGTRMAWLASPEPNAKEGKSFVYIYDTISGKLLIEIPELRRTYRVDLADEGKTLVVLPPRPDKIDRPVTKIGLVFHITISRAWEYEHRFLPATFSDGFDPGRVDLVKSAVQFRNWLLIFDDYGISRYDPTTARKLDECRLTRMPNGCGFAISADGKRIAVGEGHRFQFSDGDLASIDNSTDSHQWSTICFLPDGRLASEANTGGFGARGAGGRIYIWNVAKRKVEETIRIHAWPRVAEYAYPADSFGKMVPYVDQSQEPNRFVLRDMVKNEPALTLDWERGWSTMISGDGKRILQFKTGSEPHSVRLVDSTSGKQIAAYQMADYFYKQGENEPRFLAEDGSLFGYYTLDSRLVVNRSVTGKHLMTIGIPHNSKRIEPAWEYQSAGFDRLFFARPSHRREVSEFAVWDRNGNLLRRFGLPLDKERDYRYPILSHDGRTMTMVDEQQPGIGLYETLTGRRRGEVRPPHPLNGAVFEKAVAFSPDGRLLATSHSDTTILLWDLVKPLSGKPALSAPTNTDEAQRLWHLLGDLEPSESDRALWTLVAAPDYALRMVKKSMEPLPKPDANRLQALVNQLDSDDFKKRDEASRAITLEFDDAVIPSLRTAARTATAEQGRRLDEAIKRLEIQREQAKLRAIRALEVLERIATPGAHQLVERVAAGDEKRLATLEAQLILKRWPPK